MIAVCMVDNDSMQYDLPDGFYDSLKDVYGEDDWEREREDIVRVTEKLIENTPDNYRLKSPVGVGGSGIVFKLVDENIDEPRALKIPRPLADDQQLASEALANAREKLLSLSHENLINIYFQGAVTHDGHEFPFYVMDFVDQSEADEYLELADDDVDIVGIFHDIVKALSYLHEEDILHSDLKPENILIDSDGNPLIIDFGFAKEIDPAGGSRNLTDTGGTKGYIHPDKRDHIDAIEDENRVEVTTTRDVLREFGHRWDLYALGITFLELLDIIDEHDPGALSRYEKRYLRLLGCRMLDGTNGEDQTVLNLSQSAFEDLAYGDAASVEEDLRKLIGIDTIESEVPEIESFTASTLTVSNVENISLTDRVEETINHPLLNRLGSITQLGLMNLLYPSANHSRLEHVVGTFSILCQYVDALKNDPINPIFKQIMDADDVTAVLVCSLVYDIGQFPLAYDINRAEPAIDSAEFSEEILEGDYRLPDETTPLAEIIEDEEYWNISVERVLDILRADPTKRTGEIKDRILHTLLKGPLGADRIDYILRDSHHLGLNYGRAIDFDKLLDSFTIVFEEKNDGTYAALGIHEEGKITAESLGFAHYAMFGEAYWHHTFRAIKSMIHRLVWEMLYGSEADHDAADLVAEFKEYVRPGPTWMQQTLDSSSNTPSEDIKKTSQVHMADLEVLRWFSHRNEGVGSDLFEDLKSRNLFKRVNVFTHEKPEDTDIWDEVAKFHRNYDVRHVFGLQRTFQKTVARRLKRDRTTEERQLDDETTVSLSPDLRDEFIHDCANSVVLHIDLPPEDKVLEADVEYLKEEDRRRTEVKDLDVENLKGTAVWNGLQQNFHKSIGNLRIYCHPDHSEFFSAYFTRGEVKDMLRDSLELAKEKNHR